MNTLYFGDNLDILREYVEDESVDLVYLDPPFNSQAQYNVLFQSPQEAAAAAQAEAFLDAWTWGEEANWAYSEIMRIGGPVARFIEALRSALGQSDMMAYLVMMAVRINELHIKLKSTGSLYLHCDPTASHYLKILLDGIFGAENFRSEIVWRRSAAHNKLSKQYGPIHDTILFYSKSNTMTFHPGKTPYSNAYIRNMFHNEDGSGRFRLNELTGHGVRSGESGQPWRGYNPSNYGRHWAIPKSLRKWLPSDVANMSTQEQLDCLYDKGWIKISKEGRPSYKQYPGEGVPYQDIWAYQSGTEGVLHGTDGGIDSDVKWLDGGDERTGYPTQKPVGLLRRIIETSSNPGDIVLDPFCGCGTTVEAAQHLDRQWIGIDIAIHAIKVIEARIKDRVGEVKYKIEGIPRDYASAVRLAENNRYQFQWWANYLFNPHTLKEQKKGKDRGIDGELFFPNGPGQPWGRMLTSVKSGTVGPAMVRDFRGVLEREGAEMGLFICLNKPTKSMKEEATSAGMASTVHGDIPRLQIVSIEDWFDNKLPKLPPLEHLPTAAFSSRRRRAKTKQKQPDPMQPQLPLSFTGGKASNTKTHINPTVVYSDDLFKKSIV